MRLLLLSWVALAGLSSVVSAQQSVLVTPRLQLEVQRVQEGEPATPVAPAPQAAAPQIYYVQPPQQQSTQPDMFRFYMFNRMMFNAGYQRRGILFPRYVRRPDGTMRQMMVLHMWQQQR